MSDNGLAPLTKPDCCPQCGGKDVRRIVGGIPSEEGRRMIERGEAVLGTCFLHKDRPDWHCQECRHEWFVKDDPARIEMERLLAEILEKHGRKAANPAHD